MTIPLFDDIIKAIALICADDEDAEAGDYAYLAEALRRPATTEERTRFRTEYSAARGR